MDDIKKQINDINQLANDIIKKPMRTENKEIRLTDTTNAEKIVELFEDQLRYDHRRGRWLIWSGNNWKPDKNEKVKRFAIEAVRQLYQDAKNIENLSQRTAVAKWAIQSESKQRLDASVQITKCLEPIADAGEGWDKDPMLLSCPNGVIDLTTGELRSGEPQERISMETAVSYDPHATSPRWEQFVEQIFEGNTELIHYVHKALGYSLTGITREQVVFFCFGVGSNGKSVLFTTIGDLLKDYSHCAPGSLFQRNTLNTSTNDIADIEFKRFLISSETLSSTKVNEQRIKKWSGGDQETARHLYHENFSFYPTCKIWLFINHKPQVEDDSLGFWRRVRLIPFNRVFKGEEADPKLADKLKQEMPGILAWLVRGCLLWQKEGLSPTPSIVTSATKDYQIENDLLAEFVYGKCLEKDDAEEQAKTLYQAYKIWAVEQGMSDKDCLKLNAFARRMGDKYQRLVKRKGTFYKGIMLKTQADETEIGGNISPQSSHDVVHFNQNIENTFIPTSRKGFIDNDNNTPHSLENSEEYTTDIQNLEDYMEQSEKNL